MKKRKFLITLLCLSAMLGVSATALTSCKTKEDNPPTPVVEYWKVTIDLNDGSTPTTKDVVKGEKLTGVATPTREGYEFTGWQVNGKAWTMDTAITADITIVAQWKEKTVTPAKEYWTVTIDLNDGTDPKTQQVEKGQKLTGVAEPTREGYEFTGWKANDAAWTMDEAITADITIVAQWNELPPAKEYWTVTIDLNDDSTPKTQQVEKGQKLTGVEEPTREGYEFAGWKANDAAWTMDEAITANITIVAQWNEKPVTPVKEYWTVTIDLNDGSEPTTQQVEKGQKLTGVEEPTREGYEFTGWKANDADWTMDEAITANITIVAQWNELPPAKEYWTVTIDLNDGTDPTTQQVEKGEKLTGVEEPTREGYRFTGWKANDAAWTMDTAITANITIVAQWEELSAYEAFVSKGNVIYTDMFAEDGDVLHTNAMGDFDREEETFGKWFGCVNDSDDYDDTNAVFVQNGYLNVVDDSAKTTYAYLILSPVYASVVEVKAVIQTSTVAGSWSIFTLMSPYSSSEYLLNLRTNSEKEICLQTRVYNEKTGEYSDSALLTKGGFVFVENKDILIEATVDLGMGDVTVTLSQEGAVTKTFTAKIDPQGYLNQGLPLTFSGVQVMTAGTASRSIKIDWLAARVDFEYVEGMKEFFLSQLEADYNEYDKSEYTQQLEQLEKAYADGVAAIEAANTVAEVLEAMNGIEEAFKNVKSDKRLEAEAMVEDARQELAQLKEEYKDFYTITKDSEEDYFANKEDFENLFENAFRNLENPYSVESIQNELNYVHNSLNGWLQKDEDVLENFRGDLVSKAYNYAYENGYSNNIAQVSEDIIEPLREKLATLNTKAEMKDLYAEYLELFELIETDDQILAKAKQDACTEIEEYAELALEDLNANSEIDAELISLIGSVKENAILAINNATELYGENGVFGIKDATMNEIGELAGLAGSDLERISLYYQKELEDYINLKKSNYQPEEEVRTALDQVYTDHESDFDELTTVTAIREKLKELKGLVDAIVEADNLKKNKAQSIVYIEGIAAKYKQDIMSEALKDEYEDLKDQWIEILNSATSNEELTEFSTQAEQALYDFMCERYNRSFKVTFTNAVGATYVNYGQNLEFDNIHVTGMVVIGATYNEEAINEENPLVVYDDLVVTLIMEAVDVDLDFVEWSAEDNYQESYGVFADTEFFTLSEEATFAWYEASFSDDYSIGWQSANFNESDSDVPVLLQIKENLASLKLHIGLADSKWSSGRTGVITFLKNGAIIKELSDDNKNVKMLKEVVLENLQCGDVITIYAHDLNSGSRIYIFDVEAHLDYNAVPKTVAIIWGDAEEPTMYSHLEAVKAPEEDPVGEGAFKYWYYLDEDGEEVVFNKNEENYFDSTTEPIHMLPCFAEANVFITYINGDDEEVVPYSLGNDETGVDPKSIVAADDEEFIGWFAEGANEAYDFTAVSADTEVIVYAKWYDKAISSSTKTNTYDWTPSSVSKPAVSDGVLTTSLSDGSHKSSPDGYQPNGKSSTSRYIKVTLASTGSIKVVATINDTSKTIHIFISKVATDKTDQVVGTHMITLNSSNGSDTLYASELDAGDYYINWDVKNFVFQTIEVSQIVSKTVKYSGIDGTPTTSYTAGSELELDLAGLSLTAVTEDDSIALETIKDNLTIIIENEADFNAGVVGTYEVSITYGKHSKISYTVTVDETAE